MEIPSGVRKGTWSKEEDDLLRACVQRYGEGKWHLVPQRAGLNRCRKSCRLRWLNYIKPDIKRGNFTEDEADMMMRFHKLLGNRWSLIAARFPGRTANDVKNYWYSLIRKKKLQWSFSENKEKEEAAMKSHQVIRPKPVTLSRNWSRTTRKGLPIFAAANYSYDKKSDDSGSSRDKPIIATTTDSDSNKSDESGGGEVMLGADASAEKEWWESVLDDVNKGNEEDSLLWCLDGEEHQFLAQFWDEDQQLHFFEY